MRQVPWCHSNLRYSVPIVITASCETCLWAPSCTACTAAARDLRACAENFGGEHSLLKILAVLQVHAGFCTRDLPTPHSTHSHLRYKYNMLCVLAAVELHMESGFALFPTGLAGRLVRQAPWCHSNLRYSVPIHSTTSCGTCFWPTSCTACTAAARALRALKVLAANIRR